MRTRGAEGGVNVRTLDQVITDHLTSTLRACNGCVSSAARLLGLHRRTLQRMLWKRNIQVPR